MPALRVMAAFALLDPRVAVTVTVAGLGTLEGAVYVTLEPELAESVPQLLPLQPEPLTVQAMG